MQKFASILLICLFVFSQYAKQLSYIECKLSNKFKPDTAKCDCETKLIQDNSSVPEQPANTTHFHVHADDVYFIEQNTVTEQFSVRIDKIKSYYLNVELKGFTNLILQPPRS